MFNDFNENCNCNKDKVKCRFCYIQGPTGPRGPATINVRSTTTSEPGYNASVINGGTNQNVVLDFVIPRGATGPTGPTGPQGLQGTTGPTGPIGQSPSLTIGSVTTGEPGGQASATITGTTPNFILNLTIPQGPTGPSGIQGVQ